MSAAIALTLTACGGGSGGIAGIGGSGFTSSGSVTGFGSIFVNGVEFETDTASFNIEGLTGSQADLVTGMRVSVSGTVNADGVTGTATSVTFEDQLEGPTNFATFTEDDDMLNKQFTVLGVSVNINADDTVFVGTGFDYNTIAAGDNIQISGFYDDTGVLQATAVVKKDAFVAGTTIVEAKGTISALSSNNFTLTVGSATITVDASGADISQLTAGLVDGQFVEVKGTIISATGTSISATLVKPEDNNLTEGNDVEIEGIITRYVSVSDFDVDGQTVDASSAVKTPATFTLEAGIKIEVEGTVNNGVLQATKLKLREGEIKAHAIASSVDLLTNTFLMTISDDTIKVTVDTSTRLDDKLTSETLAVAIAKLEGQFLRVRGIDDGTGNGIIATRVRIRNPGDPVILQGVIDMSNVDVTITLLGITVEIDPSTKFMDINNMTLPDHAAFNSQVSLGTTLIRIKDKNVVDGFADEVEIQRP